MLKKKKKKGAEGGGERKKMKKRMKTGRGRSRHILAYNIHIATKRIQGIS